MKSELFICNVSTRATHRCVVYEEMVCSKSFIGCRKRRFPGLLSHLLNILYFEISFVRNVYPLPKRGDEKTFILLNR